MWCLALTSQTGAGARPTRTRNKPCMTVVLVSVFFSDVVLALAHRTVDDRNIVRFGIAANATAETAGQPHQVGIFEGFVRPGQRPPPHTKAARTMPHAEVGVQNDPIHAVVAAAQQILIESAQSIGHRGTLEELRVFETAPKGPLFRSRSAKKRRTLMTRVGRFFGYELWAEGRKVEVYRPVKERTSDRR